MDAILVLVSLTLMGALIFKLCGDHNANQFRNRKRAE